jgi:uncharacterized protein (TIGR02246 family)
MFERYTERARRVIFFARFEASQYGSPTIESEHMLLGLLREDKKGLLALRQIRSTESIRAEIESQLPRRERFPTSVEIPLSVQCKNILHYAADSAEKLEHTRVDTVHLLLGILREEECLAAKILRTQGVDASEVREREARRKGRLPGVVDVAKAIETEQAVDEIIEAWKSGEARKVAGFFDSNGILAHLDGEFWIGPTGIEKALTEFFRARSGPELGAEVTDLRCVAGGISVVTVDWEPTGGPGTPVDRLRLALVIHRNQDGWRIVSAHLMHIGGRS